MSLEKPINEPTGELEQQTQGLPKNPQQNPEQTRLYAGFGELNVKQERCLAILDSIGINPRDKGTIDAVLSKIDPAKLAEIDEGFNNALKEREHGKTLLKEGVSTINPISFIYKALKEPGASKLFALTALTGVPGVFGLHDIVDGIKQKMKAKRMEEEDGLKLREMFKGAYSEL